MSIVPLVSLLLTHGSPAPAYAGECDGGWPAPVHCFPDVLCQQYEDYWDLRRAIVHISGPDFLGTGFLINNANCHVNDEACGAPYLLTANHIASGGLGVSMSSGEIDDLQTLSSFTFGFEAGVCGGLTAGGAVALFDATIVASSPAKDLILLRLATSLPPELGAYYLGWSTGNMDQALSISHPCGSSKRIAISEPGDDIVFT